MLSRLILTNNNLYKKMDVSMSYPSFTRTKLCIHSPYKHKYRHTHTYLLRMYIYTHIYTHSVT